MNTGDKTFIVNNLMTEPAFSGAIMGSSDNNVDNLPSDSSPPAPLSATGSAAKPGRRSGGGGTLSESVFEQLRSAIISGELAPGTRLREPSLSEQYRISRGPLREALQRLASRKLVQIRPNAGATVMTLDLAQAIEIYQLREALEGLACELAASRVSPEDCAELRALLDSHEAQIRSADWQRYHQEAGDWDFHYRLVQLSGNRRLFSLLCEELYDVLRLYRRQTSVEPRRPSQALRDHQHIVEALEAGDGELAGLLMRRHIASARRSLSRQLPPPPIDGEQA